MASLKKMHAEEAIVPTSFSRLMEGAVTAMTVDPALPGITSPRPKATPYRTPMPWELPCREGSAEAARAALTASPLREPMAPRTARRRPV